MDNGQGWIKRWTMVRGGSNDGQWSGVDQTMDNGQGWSVWPSHSNFWWPQWSGPLLSNIKRWTIVNGWSLRHLHSNRPSTVPLWTQWVWCMLLSRVKVAHVDCLGRGKSEGKPLPLLVSLLPYQNDARKSFLFSPTNYPLSPNAPSPSIPFPLLPPPLIYPPFLRTMTTVGKLWTFVRSKMFYIWSLECPIVHVLLV